MARAAFSTNKDIDDSLLLGNLFFYSMGDLRIDENELMNIFAANNLSLNYIRKISKADAFRRASTKARQTIDINYRGQTEKAKIEIDELATDENGIIRTIGRKVIDKHNQELSYETIAKVIYDRDTEQIRFVDTPAAYGLSSEYNYDTIMNDMSMRYNDWAVMHTKDTVNNIVKTIIKDTYPVNMLSSGLAKFIPKASKDVLYSLKGALTDLSAYGEGNLSEIIPVVDTDEQRLHVSNAASYEIQNDLQNFVNELRDVIQTKQVLSVRTATSYVDKFKDLKKKVKEYEGLLGIYMTALDSQIMQAIKYVESNKDNQSQAS